MVARVVSATQMLDHSLTQLIHAKLHLLDVLEHINYKLSMITCCCLNGTAPQYLTAHMQLTADPVQCPHHCHLWTSTENIILFKVLTYTAHYGLFGMDVPEKLMYGYTVIFIVLTKMAVLVIFRVNMKNSGKKVK